MRRIFARLAYFPLRTAVHEMSRSRRTSAGSPCGIQLAGSPGLRTARGSSGPPGPLAPAAVRDRDATLKVYLWDASHDRRGGPAPVSRMSGSCGAGKGGRSRVGSRRRGANGSTLRRDPVGRESPARDAQRERRGAAEAQGQAAGSPHDRAAGDRLIVKTDPQLMDA